MHPSFTWFITFIYFHTHISIRFFQATYSGDPVSLGSYFHKSQATIAAFFRCGNCAL